MKAVIYARVANDPTGTALERQEAACREFAERLGADVVDVISDGARSGWSRTSPRPGYTTLLEGLRERRWDTVIAFDPARLSRRMPELEALIAAVREAGATLHTVAGTVVPT